MTPDHTLDSLDWSSVRTALAERARTPMGRRLAEALVPLEGVAAITVALDATGEVLLLEQDGGWVPVSDVADAGSAFHRAGRGGVLERDELRQAGRSLVAMQVLCDHLTGAEADIEVLRSWAPSLHVDDAIARALVDAFDEQGQLSARTYPMLGELRERIASLHGSIRRTLQDLVAGESWGDALQERFVTQRGDRYVVPVKAGFRRKEMGIVHGMSGSGQTAFVEPAEVVSLNNDLRVAEGELEAAERRILAQLSSMLGRVSDRAKGALSVAADIDLAAARATLAADLDATRPVVRDEGTVRLREARHPVLALRGIDVVPNDLTVDPAHPVLVLSGPNTGGKTIALKTVGLCALLAASGCYVPAAEGSRVDRFHTVVAVIGDHQTVHGDHSSFSSHVGMLRDMMRDAASGCLYLIDEIASGTDPTQGAALAHAVLEHLLEHGPRVVVTTHFQRLKTLHAADPRFAVAAMQFLGGEPTYRLEAGVTGESHALTMAQRYGVPDAILDRARALMDASDRALTDALANLDAERERAAEAQRRAEALANTLEAERRAVAAKEAKLEASTEALRRKEADAFVERLKRADKAIASVVAQLQADPSHAGVTAARATLAGLQGIADEVAPAPARTPTAAPAPDELAPGVHVRLTKLGKIGEIISVDGDRLEVRVGGLTTRAKVRDVERVGQPDPAPARPSLPAPPPAAPSTPLDQAVRHPGNTVDLRGKRVDEGLAAIEAFFDKATLANLGVVFILHGHGTGAMKKGVREWLGTSPYVARWAPAQADQGGDAYSVVSLR